MYAVDVIALSRSAPGSSLTYRSTVAFAPGTFIGVKLRRTCIRALVLASVPVQERKAELKTASFVLSKSEPIALGTIAQEYLEAARLVAAYHAVPLGQVLYGLYGEMLEQEDERVLQLLATTHSGAGFSVHEEEQSTATRFDAYQVSIEAAVVAGGAALLIVPTVAELALAKKRFGKYKPVVLSGELPRAKRAARVLEAGTHRGLVVATPAYATLANPHLSCILLERVSAGSYIGRMRPGLDMRIAAREVAQARQIPLVIGDYPIPLEYRAVPAHALSNAPAIHVLDVRTPKTEEASDPAPFTAVSPKALDAIAAAVQSDERVLVLVARKGYSPTIVCRDCGTLVTDDEGRTLTMARSEHGNVLRSTSGTVTIPAREKRTCTVCGGWNLLPLGIGVERVAQELTAQFPDAHVVLAQRDEKMTSAKLRQLLTDAEAPRTILVGTEFLLPWLAPEESFSLGVVATLDTLLAVPFWRARERFLRIAYLVRERTAHTLLQTRRPDDTAVRTLGALGDATFFTEEDTLRRAVGYPPYGTLVALTYAGTSTAVERMTARLVEQLSAYTPRALPARSVRGTQVSGTVVLLQPTWPSEELFARLASLPPSVRVRINPESW